MLNNLLIGLLVAAPSYFQDDPPPEKAPPTGTIVVQVVDDEGDPITGGKVYLLHAEESRRKGVRLIHADTDLNGNATLAIPAGEPYLVRATAIGRANSVEVEVEPFKDGETREFLVELKVRPDLEIKGCVVSAEDGAPIEGAQIHVDPSGWTTLAVEPGPLPAVGESDAFTDEGGRFELMVRSWTSARTTVIAEGWSPILLPLVRDGEPIKHDLTIELRRSATLRGVVDAQEAGQLTVAAVVKGHELLAPDSGLTLGFQDVLYRTNVDDEGRFELKELPSNVPLLVSVRAGRRIVFEDPNRHVLKPAEEKAVRFDPSEGSVVSGTVSEAGGDPSPGMEVWLVRDDGRAFDVRFMERYERPSQRTVTDGEGRFRFEETLPGRWVVGLAPSPRRARVRPEDAHAAIGFLVEVGLWDVEQDLPVHRGLYIDGTIVDASGDPIEGRVRVSGHVKGGPYKSDSFEGGPFRLGPLVPGDWSIQGEFSGHGVIHYHARSEAVDVAAGTKDLRLKLQRGGALTSRAVHGENDEPIDAAFQLYRDGVIRLHTFGAQSGFDRSGLLPGDYTLTATTPDGKIGMTIVTIELAKTTADVDVPLAPCGFIEVTYTGPEPYASIGIHVEGVCWNYDTVQSGIPHRLHAPAGKVTVRVSKNARENEGFPGFDEKREVVVIRGRETSVRIVIPEFPD